MKDLRFEEVTVRYGTGRSAMTAVDRVRLTVPAGSMVGLVGESGSGKSTLVGAAVGLAPVTGGRILLGDRDVRELPASDRHLQMVFQNPYSSLNPRMTVGESIREAIPRGAHRSKTARREEVERLLGLVNLDADRAGLLPGQLSGGQCQRVALARALAGQPEIIFADEITSALDVSVQGTVLNLVKDLQRDVGFSMLFISHNLAVVRYISDFVAVMHLGRIVEIGTVEEILTDPQHPYTRDLLAAAPTAGGSLLSGDLGPTADAEPADPHNPPTGCHYHPRCPVGPAVRQERSLCLRSDPAEGADTRPHRAACHYPGTSTPSDGPS